MADYIYLLETRLSLAQQRALGTLRTIARESDATTFLTGGAVRDLTGGGSIRDLDVTVQGDALKLRKALEKAGVEISGENAAAHQLFLVFPGGVRVELASAVSVTYLKPGKPKYELGSLTDDLRRRDFTANAMAISLNEGSYGLLMDPLNGVADIENRELRLVSNYGFIEDPSRLIRAARLSSRLGWQMEDRTRQRYDTAKEEGYISALNPWNKGYELEEIFHEEDPVRILRSLEAEGWMTHLSPALSSGKANTTALSELADKQGQLQMQGVLSQSAAIAFPLITAKLSASDIASLKASFPRQGFVREIESLDARARDFAARFASKEAAAPSSAWKMLHDTEPNLVLAMSYGSKTGSVQTRLKTFLTESPTARQRIPYTMLQEMRITPDLPVYAELLDKLFFELMDNKLSTPEEMKTYLEPYSPPAPPPPVNLRRARAKKEARPSRAKGKKAAAEAEPIDLTTVAAQEEAAGMATGLTEVGDLTGPDRGPDPTPDVPLVGKVAPEVSKPAEKKAGGNAATPIERPAELPSARNPKPAKGSKQVEPAPPAVLKAPAKAGPVVVQKADLPATKEVKASGGKNVVAKKSLPQQAAKKAVKAPAKVAAVKVAKKAAPAAKKAVPAAKTAAKKAPAPAKKAVSAKKAVVAKKATPAKAAKKAAAKKSARR